MYNNFLETSQFQHTHYSKAVQANLCETLLLPAHQAATGPHLEPADGILSRHMSCSKVRFSRFLVSMSSGLFPSVSRSKYCRHFLCLACFLPDHISPIQITELLITKFSKILLLLSLIISKYLLQNNIRIIIIVVVVFTLIALSLGLGLLFSFPNPIRSR
jgi:hypothetical protein